MKFTRFDVWPSRQTTLIIIRIHFNIYNFNLQDGSAVRKITDSSNNN